MSICYIAPRSLFASKASRWFSSSTTNTRNFERIKMSESEVTENFRYTSGRWLYNESLRLSERNLDFNVPALMEAAARSIGQNVTSIRSFRKLAEGGFNRIFELTMNDGAQVVARLPYPVTQPKCLAVASEVATMGLVRSRGIPVPKVFDYCANSANPVGVEYILMERARGRLLGDIWFTMSEKERIKVLSSVVENEAKLFAIDLPANGSIFRDKDLSHSMDRIPITSKSTTQGLCVGPDVSLKFWFEERSALDIRRKPFVTPSEVLLGTAAKEMAWLQKYAKPRLPFDRMYRDITNFEPSDPKEHFENLKKYSQIASQLVPREDWLCRPTLRHPDLNPNNLFVSDAFEISGIIDWQHSRALPLFLCAGIPSHFQNYSDPESEELVKPQLSTDLDTMEDDDREQELELFRRRHVHFYYSGATAQKNEPHFDAMMHKGGLFRRQIFEHAGEPWEGNSIPLKADLIRLAQHWSDVVGSGSSLACPILFEATEADQAMQGALKQEEVDGQMAILRNAIGIGSDGWVSYEGYESAVAEAARMKAQAIDCAEDDFERQMTLRHWPFEDHDERE